MQTDQEKTARKLWQICEAFRIPGDFDSYDEIKVGNVNRTYRVNCRQPDGSPKSYMIQRINTYAFREPVKVMENIDHVTEHIRAKRPDKVALHFHHTGDRRNYVSDADGFWRLFNYVPSVTYNATQNWLLSVEDRACTLTDLYNRGELPLRVTHNDTKINNVLFDEKTDRALVVIDLDTVMPGLVGHDFGDAIRFAANRVEEDSPDAAKAGVNMAVFRAFAEGFLSQTAATLTKNEIDTLALSCFALTCELATRFLDDYILGSPYFKTDYPEHNLVRTRCQIALAKDMLGKLEEMEAIVWGCVRKSEEGAR